jgi:hypothetical protein
MGGVMRLEDAAVNGRSAQIVLENPSADESG